MKPTLLKIILLLFITFSITNCDKDNIIEKQQDDIQQIKNEYSLENFNDINIKNNLSIDWDDYIQQKNPETNSNSYEFNGVYSYNNFIENGKLKLFFKYKLFVSKDDSKLWNLHLVKFSTNNETLIQNISYFYLDSFSGTLSQFNLKGETLGIKGFKNGVLVSEFENNKSSSDNTNIYSKQKNIAVNCSDCYVLVTIEHYTDWFKSGPGVSWIYTHSTLNYVSHEYVYVGEENNSGLQETYFHDHISPSHGGSYNNHENEVVLEENIYLDLSNTSKINPTEELKCFDLTKNAKLTVYVQQPKENTSEIYSSQNGPGHAFIGLEQNGIVRQIGFYPISSANEIFVGVGIDYNSELRDNNNYLYHVSISKDITSSQLTSISNYIKNFPKTYNVNNFACTDFAIKIGNMGGMGLPSTSVSSLTFKGRSPGQLGQEIRAMNSDGIKTINKIKNNSPNKEGTCN